MKAILFLKRDQRCRNTYFNFTKNITYGNMLNSVCSLKQDSSKKGVLRLLRTIHLHEIFPNGFSPH